MNVRTTILITAVTLACRADVISDTMQALSSGDVSRAENVVRADQTARGITPESLEAASWIARVDFENRRIDAGDAQAKEVLALYEKALARRGVDSDPHLATAVGAAIEVHAQALAVNGQRTAAIAFLHRESAAFATTSIAARIRKNLNLLTITGRVAPPIDDSRWIGAAKPPSLLALRGRPVLLFFWAHWCGDCKADAPIIAKLSAEYAGRGLAVIGPTQLYGYTPQNEKAPPDEEMAWTRRVFDRFYAQIPGMTAPVSAAAFRQYGASTTPTIVLIDKAGVVRLYHPGAMTEAELKPELERVMEGSGRAPAARSAARGQ